MKNRKFYGLLSALFVTTLSFAAQAQQAVVDCRIVRIQQEKESAVAGSARKTCVASESNLESSSEIPIYWTQENFWGTKKKVRFGSLLINLDFKNKEIASYEAEAGHPMSRPFRSEHPNRMPKPLFISYSDKSYELMQDFWINGGEKSEFNGRMSMRCEVHFLKKGVNCPDNAVFEAPALDSAPKAEPATTAFPTAGATN